MKGFKKRSSSLCMSSLLLFSRMSTAAATAAQSKILYIVRHGQALHNPRAEAAKAAGCSMDEFFELMRQDDALDADLTELGRQQARACHQKHFQHAPSTDHHQQLKRHHRGIGVSFHKCKPVLNQRCASCHTKQSGNPLPLRAIEKGCHHYGR